MEGGRRKQKGGVIVIMEEGRKAGKMKTGLYIYCIICSYLH